MANSEPAMLFDAHTQVIELATGDATPSTLAANTDIISWQRSAVP